MSDLLILGKGGLGRMTGEVAKATGRWERIVFLDDAVRGADEHADARGVDVGDLGEVDDQLARHPLRDLGVDGGAQLVRAGHVNLAGDADEAVLAGGARRNLQAHVSPFSQAGYSPVPEVSSLSPSVAAPSASVPADAPSPDDSSVAPVSSSTRDCALAPTPCSSSGSSSAALW